MKLAALILSLLFLAGCYSRRASFDGIDIESQGFLLDRKVSAELERRPDGSLTVRYSAQDNVDPALAAAIEAAVRAAIQSAR